MENPIQDVTQIKGWGVDANPENDPTYPMKARNDGEQLGYSWERPPQQPLTVEVLHSNERPNVSAAFGTSAPPAYVSGMIRRFAFKYSESSYGHWLPLMLADRVSVVEGIIADIAHGHPPNIFEELGGKAEWEHNRKTLVTRGILGVALTLIAISYFRSERNNS